MSVSLSATTTTSSLHFLSKTPLYSNSSSNFNSVSFFPNIFTSNLSLSLSSPTKPFKPICCSRLKVALDEDTTTFSSDLDEEEEENDDNRSFSPDLKLFVGNLPFNCDSAVLAGLFGRAGTVEMVEVIYDKITGRSRGFAFVTMSTVQEVKAAAQQFNGYELEGRALRVNSGPPPPREENSFRAPRGGGGYGGGGGGGYGGGGGGRTFDNNNRVYVGNLSWDVDNVGLETLFSEQGKVVEAKVVYDRETGRSRGFGFVTYGSSNEVNRAIDNLNGADLEGRQIRVSAAEAPQRRQY